MDTIPVFNRKQNLRKMVAETKRNIVDKILQVDDCSNNKTISIPQKHERYMNLFPKSYGCDAN